jgi:TerD domain
VELVLRDTDGAPWARTVLDAGTLESSLVLAEFYQRGGRWRFRVIGQGYEEPVVQLSRCRCSRGCAPDCRDRDRPTIEQSMAFVVSQQACRSARIRLATNAWRSR